MLPFSGRELFLADASIFVDDAEAYEMYQREEYPDEDSVRSAASWFMRTFSLLTLSKRGWIMCL